MTYNREYFDIDKYFEIHMFMNNPSPTLFLYSSNIVFVYLF